MYIELRNRIAKLSKTYPYLAIAYSNLLNDHTGLMDMVLDDIEESGYRPSSIPENDLVELIGNMFYRSKH